MTIGSATDHSTRGGRWREAARNDRIVLLAAREVVADLGPDAPVSEIARRAGVGVASLYRRYPTKQTLLETLCLTALADLIEAADLAVAAHDARHGLRRFIERCTERRVGAFLPLASEIELGDRLRATIGKARSRLEELVGRAKAMGALRNDLEAPDLLHLVIRHSQSQRGPAHHRAVALAIDGMLTGPHRPLPSAPPSWEEALAL